MHKFSRTFVQKESQMKKMQLLAILLLALGAVSCGKGGYKVIQGYAQGGVYSVKINTDGASEDIKTISRKVDSLLVVIDNTLSGYNKSSVLSRLNAGDSLEPGAMFRDIYARSYAVWKETEGAVDVAAGPLFNAWGFGFTNDSLPSAQTVDSLLKICGMGRLSSDLDSSLKLKPVLNFNAIAQGYSCDVIAGYLHSIGIRDMLVDIGEIYCEGLNPSGKPWTIGVDRPVDGNNTPGADLDGVWQSDGGAHGVVTSGNYRKFYIRDGKKYSHTIDPRNGWPVTHNLLSATIIAPDATSADAYATYCMVLGLDEAVKFISELDELEGYLIYDDGGVMKEWASAGFNLVKR